MSLKSEWTCDIDSFIAERNSAMKHKDLLALVNETFGKSFTINQFNKHLCEIGINQQKSIPYSQDEDIWLINNFNQYRMSDLLLEFSNRFGRKVQLSTLRNHCRLQLNLKKDTQHQFAKEEIEFVNELNRKNIQYASIAKLFKEKFGVEVSVNSLKNLAKRYNITKTKHISYTKEQDEWLIAYFDKFNNYTDCAQKFNAKFGTNKTERGIQSHCIKVLNINSGRQAFKKGDKPWCTREKYHETTLASGYTYVKLDDRHWIPKQQFIWEQEYGKLKDNEFVIFLNKDISDFRLENLAVVNRKKHLQMCNNKWYSEEPELTKTGLLVCELEQSMRDYKENSNA